MIPQSFTQENSMLFKEIILEENMVPFIFGSCPMKQGVRILTLPSQQLVGK